MAFTPTPNSTPTSSFASIVSTSAPTTPAESPVISGSFTPIAPTSSPINPDSHSADAKLSKNNIFLKSQIRSVFMETPFKPSLKKPQNSPVTNLFLKWLSHINQETPIKLLLPNINSFIENHCFT